jgi:hypothetical protein
MNGHSIKLLGGLILALVTMLANAGFWLLSRMAEMDRDRQAIAIMVEQRMTRVETKLDLLLRRFK